MSRFHKPTAHRKKATSAFADCGLPFPNFALGKTEIPAVCRCIYDGTNFFVTNHLDMHTLHYNGSFGTSSLTFRGLSYDDTSFVNKFYYKKKLKKGLISTAPSTTNGLSVGQNDRSVFKFKKSGVGKRLKVEMAPLKSAGSELCVHVSQEVTANPEIINGRHRTNSEMSVDDDGSLSTSTNIKKADEDEKSDDLHSRLTSGSRVPKIDAHVLEEEKLILMPEEAIFLSFGVGCLAIHNLQGQTVDYRQCWKNLISVDPAFPVQYAAYHYFRGKNWVPKNGDNYGASYVLYEVGPKVNHSTYIVHVLESTKPKPTWLELAAWQRLATHVGKHTLLCEVAAPKEFRPEFSDPRSIFEMKLKEVSLMRWLPRNDPTAN